MLMALDAVGDVVWHYRTDSRISDFEKLDNGNLAFLTVDNRLLEIDCRFAAGVRRCRVTEGGNPPCQTCSTVTASSTWTRT